ncbi:hypothetical protein M153_72720001136, partial [Pseudoloma neurophilia]
KEPENQTKNREPKKEPKNKKILVFLKWYKSQWGHWTRHSTFYPL